MTYRELCSLAERGGEKVLIRATKDCRLGTRLSQYLIKEECLCYITNLIQDPDIPYVAGVEASLPVRSVDIELPLSDHVSVFIPGIPAGVITKHFEIV